MSFGEREVIIRGPGMQHNRAYFLGKFPLASAAGDGVPNLGDGSRWRIRKEGGEDLNLQDDPETLRRLPYLLEDITDAETVAHVGQFEPLGQTSKYFLLVEEADGDMTALPVLDTYSFKPKQKVDFARLQRIKDEAQRRRAALDSNRLAQNLLRNARDEPLFGVELEEGEDAEEEAEEGAGKRKRGGGAGGKAVAGVPSRPRAPEAPPPETADEDGAEWDFYGESDVSDDDADLIERPGHVKKAEQEGEESSDEEERALKKEMDEDAAKAAREEARAEEAGESSEEEEAENEDEAQRALRETGLESDGEDELDEDELDEEGEPRPRGEAERRGAKRRSRSATPPGPGAEGSSKRAKGAEGAGPSQPPAAPAAPVRDPNGPFEVNETDVLYVLTALPAMTPTEFIAKFGLGGKQARNNPLVQRITALLKVHSVLEEYPPGSGKKFLFPRAGKK